MGILADAMAVLWTVALDEEMQVLLLAALSPQIPALIRSQPTDSLELILAAYGGCFWWDGICSSDDATVPSQPFGNQLAVCGLRAPEG